MDKGNFAKGKKLLVMPVLILPFITLAFWALGGGREQSKVASSVSGLNLQLPEAQPKNQKVDSKLSYYEEAARDSATLKQAMKKDPYFQSIAETNYAPFQGDTSFNEPPANRNRILKEQDVNEERVYAKIRELNQHLKENNSNLAPTGDLLYERQSRDATGDLGRVMHNLTLSQGKDSEMIALNSLMDKIITIQHPEKLKVDLTNENREKGTRIYKVTGVHDPANKSFFGSSIEKEGQGAFYGYDDSLNNPKGNLISAEVEQDQTLYPGSILKMRLLQEMFLAEEKLEKGSFIYGIVSIEGSRLKVNISSVRLNNSVYPVDLMAYDMDGLPGINLPWGTKGGAEKPTSINSLQGLDLATLDPSIKAQVTSAGIHALKTWVNQKTKEVKVFVKEGYRIFLGNRKISKN